MNRRPPEIHYKNWTANAVREQIAIYSENQMKRTNTRRRKNGESSNVKQVGYIVTAMFSGVNNRSAFPLTPSLWCTL
jgi:hypothetical protein